MAAATKAASPTLETLWQHEPSLPLTCLVCGGSIINPQALARTFSLTSCFPSSTSKKYSRKIPIPAEDDEIVLYDRHVDCIRENGVRYVTVSHVWNAAVADKQYKRGESAVKEEVAAKLAVELPVRVYRDVVDAEAKEKQTRSHQEHGQGGHGDGEAPLELWHDYISVPQWRPAVKDRILLAIPKLYAHAAYTVVHLDDVDSSALKLLRQGQSSRERLTGMAKICNAAWYSRVWTAMEFVQSAELRVMLSDGAVEGAGGNVFLGELDRVFAREIREHGDGHAVSRLVDSLAGPGSSSLKPWMLGGLCQVRTDVKRGASTEFAMAFCLLAKRRLTRARDFFYALRGILHDVNFEVEKLRNDPQEACLQVARVCMARGDYSPLLMIPDWVREGSDNLQFHVGFNDVNTWGLDQVVTPGVIVDGITPRGGNKVLLKCEEIGTVHFMRRFRYHDLFEQDPTDILNFSYVARLVLDFTGPDIEAFVETVGGRLYGQNPQAIFDRLARQDRYQGLKQRLTLRYDVPFEHPWGAHNASWIAEAMGLSNLELNAKKRLAPLKFLRHHGGTLHLGLSGALVGIACPGCHGRFVYRVAPYKPLSEMLGAVAYRIPGLKYAQSHKDGVAILVKDGRVVGRMVWATPACACHEMREVEVELSKLSVPAPNEFAYGVRGK